MRLNRGRLNLLLASTSFTLSAAGSVLLQVVLALTIYKQTGSVLLTSLFVALQWLPPFLVVLYRSDWEHGLAPRIRWYRLDLLSAALTLPVFFLVDGGNYLAIVVVLLLRGVVDQINRINKTIAARVLFPQEKATHYASLLQSSNHVGIAVVAIAGVFFADYFDLKVIVLINTLSFVLSAVLIMLSRPVAERPYTGPPVRRSFLARLQAFHQILANDPRLLLYTLLMPLTATFFQGSYSVLQPIFPLERFGLDVTAVLASYVLASFGILLGSWSFSWWCKRVRLFEGDTRPLVIGCSALAAVLYLGVVSAPGPLLSGACFALMVVLFGFLWMMGYSGTVALAPTGQLGTVFGIAFALGSLFSSLLSAVLGLLLAFLGNSYVYLIALLMFAYWAGIALLLWPKTCTTAVAFNN